jgi:F0F1-type ATP synthase membrane subunit c/vacuolar-type H+-ATPase subunit K
MLALYLVGAMMKNPELQKKMNGKMSDGMLMPYKKVIKEK